jgi:hypothetical protein
VTSACSEAVDVLDDVPVGVVVDGPGGRPQAMIAKGSNASHRADKRYDTPEF